MSTLNRSNLWYSRALLFLALLTIASFSCHKDGSIVPVETPVTEDTVKPKISFVFVNKSGYKADTNSARWFQAVNLYSKYYNPDANMSRLVNIVYNRNHNGWPTLLDSIVHKKYISVLGGQYAYEVSIYWYYKNVFPFSRELIFRTKNWPNASDTIKVAKDTVIKFVYPDDTLPNTRFIRVQ